VTAFVAVMLWGACGWAMLVPIQHRLAGVNPAVAQMSISLSSSANYAGVSLAPVIGHFFLDRGVDMRYLGVPSAAIVVAGLLIGEAGYLLIRRGQRQAEAEAGEAPAGSADRVGRAGASRGPGGGTVRSACGEPEVRRSGRAAVVPVLPSAGSPRPSRT
jgi:hypothetical protein